MRLIISFSVLTLTILAPLIIAQGFQNSCSPIAFETPQLAALCSQDNGQQHFTELDLDFCVGNQSGNLVHQVNGTFSSSCSDCSLSDIVLECNCETGSGSNNAAIDLTTFISNHNGNLEC